MANEESSSSASIAPCVAMMALTPHTAEPTANSEVSLGRRPKARPRKVMNAIATVISMATSARLTPPSFSTSTRRKREPSSTTPASPKFQPVAKEKAGAEQHDTRLQPEFVGGHAGAKNLWHTDGI